MSPAGDADRGQSLETAQQRADQTIRMFNHAVIHELDPEVDLAIEINGVPVRKITCMDSALAELAAGWAFLYHFCVSPDEFDRSTVNENRASVMVRGGSDISARLAILSGSMPDALHAPDPFPRDEAWSIPDDILLDVLREAWLLFRNDHMAEGSIHAALANERGVEVVAFDNNAEAAVAKVLGWCLITERLPAFEILIVNGPITRTIVDAAARIGVLVIATPFAPTSHAYMTARVSGMNIIGYMRHATVGLFGGPGLVSSEDEDSDLT